MANVTVPVTANVNIKIPVDLKLQLKTYGTLISIYINLIYLTINFLCIELKKVKISENIFKFKNYFFSNGTRTANKFDGVIPVMHF